MRVSPIYFVMILVAAFSWCCGLAVAEEEAWQTIVVPRTVIYPGDVISEGAVVDRRIGGGQAAFGMKRDDVVGKVARRTLMRGQPIPSSAVRERDVVVQGRTYALIYKSDSLTVTGSGVPLQSGSAGQVINVRNPDTGVVIKARVSSDETLVVDVP